MGNRVWGFVRSEPLVHFLGVAALLFIINEYVAGDHREVINVDYSIQEFLIEQQQDLLLRPLGDEEKEELLQRFVDEEILVREARKKGFDNSSRIRALLLQNMRFFIANDVPEPTEDDLREYYNANLRRFETPPRVSYDHVVFRDADAVPAETLQLLNDGADHTRMGSADALGGSRLLMVDQRSIVATFGPEVAGDVLAIADADWHGPFRSPQGAHFLRVIERTPSRRPSFEDARSWVASEWSQSRRSRIIERELATMRDNYRIEIAGPEEE